MGKKDIEIGNVYGRWTVVGKGKTIKTKKGYRRYWVCKCSCEYETVKEVRDDGLIKGTSSGCSKCGHKKDLTGQKFGYLTVLGLNKDTHTNYNHTFYDVRCKCGTEYVIRSDALTTGGSTSCGCSKEEHIDLVGQKFGKLTILEYVERYNYGEIKEYNTSVNMWKCECECGNIVIMRQSNFTSRKVYSCGCEIRSHGEIKIANLLTKWGIKFVEQYRFVDCKYKNTLPFDFALIDENNIPYFLIEFDGEFHDRPICMGDMTYAEAVYNLYQTQIRDNIKSEYSNNKNIKLLRLSYDDFYNGNIEYILFDELAKYGVIEEIKIA